VLVLPLAVLTSRQDGPADRVEPAAPPAVSADRTPSPSSSAPLAGKLRIVGPGERVTAEDGTKLWLTREGVHWQRPDDTGPDPQFTSVVDGNLDLGSPGVGIHQDGYDGGAFLSGVFHGGTEGAAVRVVTTFGTTVEGTAVRLPDAKGWGAWYVALEVPRSATVAKGYPSLVRKVTVYDREGGVVAETDYDG
jgi:hypothetical protein